MLEILFSISFSLFGGNIIDTKLEHHKYEKENYNANNSTPLENGFEFGFGESNYIVVLESKTHYYVCSPHLPGMKARIIVH